MTKFRKGDIVSIRGIVESYHGERINIIIEGYYGCMNRPFGVDDVTLVSRKELMVGDIVKTISGTKVVIRALHDKYAWCEGTADGSRGLYGTYSVEELAYLA